MMTFLLRESDFDMEDVWDDVDGDDVDVSVAVAVKLQVQPFSASVSGRCLLEFWVLVL